MSSSANTKSPCARTPFEQFNATQTQLEVKSGEFWCIKMNDEEWPVVICDEEILQRFFKDQPRPANARRANGTWIKDSAGNKCYPALIPGTLKLCWPGSKALQPFDDKMGKAIRASTTNPLLAKSWDEAIDCEEWNRGIGWWKEKLVSKDKAGFRARHTHNACKEKEMPSSDGSVEKLSEHKLWWKNLFLPPPEDATSPHIKKEVGSLSSPNFGTLYGNLDPTHPERGESNKRSKLGSAFRASTPPLIPVSIDGGSRHGTPFALHRPSLMDMRATMSSSSPQSTPSLLGIDADIVSIYVGNPHRKFRARRSGLDGSPLLSSLVTYHPRIGWYIMSPLLSSLDPDDFPPVGQYLERGEYNPNILDEGTEWVRLEDDMTHQQCSQEVVRCGTIYSLAQTLEISGLTDLAPRKLKALAKQQPCHPLAILCVVDAVFESGDEDLRDFLVHYLADNYWNVVLAEPKKVAALMQGDDKLSRRIFGLLSGEASASSTTTAQSSGKDNGKAEPDLEAKIDDGLGSIKDLGLEGRFDFSIAGQMRPGMDQPVEPELVLTEEEEKWMREDDDVVTIL